jgi:hypothetical protein
MVLVLVMVMFLAFIIVGHRRNRRSLRIPSTGTVTGNRLRKLGGRTNRAYD